MDSYVSFKNSDRFGGPWNPTSLLKIQTDSAVRGSFFENSDRVSDLYPVVAVRGSLLSPLKISTASPCIPLSRDFTWGERMTHKGPRNLKELKNLALFKLI